jgi:hypothetical protein
MYMYAPRRRRSVWFLAVLCACAATGHGGGVRYGAVTVVADAWVSSQLPGEQHWEVVAAAHPRDARRLLAVGLVDRGVTATQFLADAVVYRSADGGASWAIALDLRGKAAKTIDPSCCFAADGTAFVALMLAERDDAPWQLALYRSPDGGTTWSGPALAPGSAGVDRPFIAVAAVADGPATVLVTAHVIDAPGPVGAPRPPRALALFRSTDGGASLQLPVLAPMPDGGWFTAPGGIAVLPDGAVATVFHVAHVWHRDAAGERVELSPPHRALRCFVSRDGGATTAAAGTIAEPSMQPSTVALAADTSGGPFRGRLYAAWDDAAQDLSRVRVAYSEDVGRTWSQPVLVSDNVPWPPPGGGPDVAMPALAVNGDGVVGVAWYDERGSRGREHLGHLGYECRFAASLDGGETFAPSVVVASPPRGVGAEWLGVRVLPPSEEWGTRAASVSLGAPFLGHTLGLCAAADGAFHAVWVDPRGPRTQVRTARVDVAGVAARNGSPALAGLDDVTTDVVLEVANARYDRDAEQVTAELCVRNASPRTLHAPLWVRALTLSGGHARPVALDADAGGSGAGAAWDLSACVPVGGLSSGQRTVQRTVRFALVDLHRGAPEIAGFRGNVVHLDARVLAARDAPR